jgi:predicted PurR-regulated permease PerM
VTVLGLLGALLTALVVAFFLNRDADSIATWLLDRLVPDEQRELVAAAGRRAGDTLRGYVQGVIIIGGLDAILIGIVLLVLDVPLAVPLAVLTFLGGFFPVVGATVAGGLAALVALVSGGWVQGLVVAGATVAIQQIDGNLLQPVIMGRAVNLHPLVILLVLTAGGLLAGIAGAFLAVPVTAAAAAIGNEVRLRRDEEAVEARTAEAQPAPG